MADSNRPLWAPWRIEFILGEKESECFLCNKLECTDTKEETLIVARGEHVFIILNRYPYNSGHLMVVPYRHIGDICDLNNAEKLEMMNYLILAKKALTAVMNPDGFNVGFNLGSAAGAGLEEHLHQHIVPRWNGDTNFMPVFSGSRVVPEALEKTAEKIREAINQLQT
jgi:ATP adenylyltransferase